eukprot:Pompholyxophrys_punicea_v1_NODE_45_length_4488_cov_29.272953.p1 type:complete len:1020 gc:universal NODE_45_length_4488_cov_29.272953:3145-86(-)
MASKRNFEKRRKLTPQPQDVEIEDMDFPRSNEYELVCAVLDGESDLHSCLENLVGPVELGEQRSQRKDTIDFDCESVPVEQRSECENGPENFNNSDEQTNFSLQENSDQDFLPDLEVQPHCEEFFSDSLSASDMEDYEVDLDNPEVPLTSGWFPFPDKATALLWVLVHGTGHHYTEGMLTNLWNIFGELGAHLPPLSRILKFSKNMPNLTPTEVTGGDKDKNFHILKPSDVLKLTLNNPTILQNLFLYPKASSDGITEVFESKRWHDSVMFKSPMIQHELFGKIFVGDFVSLTTSCTHKTNTYFKITKFFIENKALCAEGHFLVELAGGRPRELMLITQKESLKCDQFKSKCSVKSFDNGTDLFVKHESLDGQTWILLEEDSKRMLDYVHPLKKDDKRVLMTPLWMFSDEVKGNLTKKFKLFESWLWGFVGLTKKENNKLSNQHFLCTSDQHSAIEMQKAIVDDISKLEEGVDMDVWIDGHSETVKVVASVMYVKSDGARSSNLSGHVGARGKHYCRLCMATNESPACVTRMRTMESLRQVIQKFKEARLQSEKNKIRLESGFSINFLDNEFFRLKEFDMFLDLPIDVLHVLLLGCVKHVTQMGVKKKLRESQKVELRAFLAEFDFTAFSEKLYGDVTKHCGSFVGRDFKKWVQISVFALSSIAIDEKELEVWIRLAMITRLAYENETNGNHQSLLLDEIFYFLSQLAIVWPTLLKRSKEHMLLHLILFLARFGPTNVFNTDRCETFNGLIRAFHVFSNKLHPSRDIALAFAQVEICKALVDGARYGQDLRMQAGPEFLEWASSNKVREMLHLPSEDMSILYKLRNPEKNGRCPRIFKLGELTTPLIPTFLDSLRYWSGSSILTNTFLDHGAFAYRSVSCNKKKYPLGTFFRYSSNLNQEKKYGRLVQLFQLTQAVLHTQWCVVQGLEKTRYLRLRCPVYELKRTYCAIPLKFLGFAVSFVQVKTFLKNVNNAAFFVLNTFRLGDPELPLPEKTAGELVNFDNIDLDFQTDESDDNVNE